MQRTSTGPRTPDPFFDPARMEPGHGGMVDWSRVSAFFEQGKFTVVVNGAVAAGVEALTVDALENELKAGTVLDFGSYVTVTATVGVAGAAIGAVSVPVAALTGPIPSGTILDFTGTGKFAKLTATAALGATTLAVEALPQALVSGDAAVFEGGDQVARLTADAAAGATALVVEPTAFAIADNAEAIVKIRNSAIGRRIPKGTVICKTTAGLLIPRREGTGAGSEVAQGFLVSDADEFSASDSKSGYGIVVGGTAIYENLCPDAGTMGAAAGDLPAAWKTELNTNTMGFIYYDYTDSRLD